MTTRLKAGETRVFYCYDCERLFRITCVAVFSGEEPLPLDVSFCPECGQNNIQEEEN